MNTRTLSCLFAGLVALSTICTDVQAQSADKDEKPLQVGEVAADFELQGLGKKVKLSDNFGADGKNVVVVFSRANW